MRRITGIAAALAAVGVLALPSMSLAQATVVRETMTTPLTPQTGLTACVPGVTGTLTGTNVLSYQSVETRQGFHTAGTSVDTGRIAWSDGTHTDIESIDRFSFNVGTGTQVATDTHEDSGDLYTADGVFLSHYTFHSVERFTITDGVIRANFEKFHLNLFGQDC